MSNISKSNNKNNKAKIKNEILNWLLFCPKKEWNPHSNAVLFSAFGLYVANIKFTANSITANNGIKNK